MKLDFKLATANGTNSAGVVRPLRSARAFTLIEVVLATAILFMCTFAILGLLASGIHAASILKQNGPTPGMIASLMTMSNTLEAGSDSGVFQGMDAYRDYSWSRQVQEFATNGLYEIDVTVFHNGEAASSLSMLLYRPDSGNSLGRRGGR